MNSKRVLVTGGLGFLGASLVCALVKRGEAVRILDNSLRGSVEKLGKYSKEVEIIAGDIRDPAAVRKAVKGTRSVMHLAYLNGTEYFYKYPDFVLDVGIKGMVNILDSSIVEGVEELIVASSSEVYQTPPMVPTPETVPLSVPDPLNPRYSYGGGKILYELMALNYGRKNFKKVIVFRPHNVYGSAMGFEHVIPQFVARLKELAAGGKKKFDFPIQGSGDQTRSFIYIDDFTDGLLLSIDKGEHLGIYHIGTQEEISMKELAHKVASKMGLEITIVPGPELKGGTPRRCPDTTKLKALGFSPKFSLDQGLALTVDWYGNNSVPEKKKSFEPALFLPS